MDSSLPQTSNNDVPKDLMADPSTSGSTVVPSQQAGAPSNSSHGVEPEATPAKRRPGRPKGSGKKMTAAVSGSQADSTNKIKRPVGRPRKDGLPAGSLKATNASASAGRPGRPRKSAPPKIGGEQNKQSATALSGQAFTVSQPGPTFHPYYPPNAPYQAFSASAGMQQVPGPSTASGNYHIDPNLDRDEWAHLARTKPNTFLQSLLSSLAAPNPVSTAGPSVEEAFKSHLVSLAPSTTSKESQAIPSLYSILKTFWLPSSPAYFSLTASASTARTPSEHRFLYWDPQPLVFNGIVCPKCSVPLINRGRIRSGPMKIYDLEKPFFIVGCEYICKSPTCVAQTSPEGRKFASTDASILRSLPARLRDEFPVHLVQGDNDMGSGLNVWNWQATGVSRSLWNMVRGCLRYGITRDAILGMIRAIQNGVPEEEPRREEEERGNDSGEEDGEGSPEVTQRSPSATVQDGNRPGSTDAYNNAWKANSAVVDPNATSGAAQAGPSILPAGAMAIIQAAQQVSQPAPQQMPQQTPQQVSQQVPQQLPQQFGFTQGGPYVAYPYQTYPYFAQQQPLAQPPPSNSQVHTPQSGTSEQNALKRPFGYTDGTPDLSILEPSQKRTRHCCKCGSQECKGKGGRSFCLNTCQDCGKLECKGRNSRRPDKRCDEAWS